MNNLFFKSALSLITIFLGHFSVRVMPILRTGILGSHLLSGICVLSVGGSLPLPGPSNPSSSEDSSDLQVLSEPWPVTHNVGYESSLRNRIFRLENSNSPFLLSKERGEYWAEVKKELYNCPSQREYNRLLEFENRDLQIRELRHSCYCQFQRLFTDHPALAENADSNPQEALLYFFNEKGHELDQEGGTPLVKDRRELRFLDQLLHDLRKNGINSVYFNIPFGRTSGMDRTGEEWKARIAWEGRRTMILSVLSSPALVSGLMVVRAKNPVHSVLFLIPVFRNTSGLLLLLGLDFFAMIFPVVYIGAIAVSFLFVVMMFHIQIAEIHEEVLRYLPVSGIIGLIFWWEMFFILDNESIPLLPTQRNTTSLRYTVYAGKIFHLM
ncbi:hypothetical protein P3L10_003532 [Capsicum annuum]